MFTTGNWFDNTVGTYRGQWDWLPSLPEQILPVGKVGIAYSYPMQGQGAWSATGLPSGLSISASGLITGTPSTTADSAVTFTVANAGRQVSRDIVLTVTADLVKPTVTTTSLNAATAGTAGSQQLAFAGSGTITAVAVGLPSGADMSSTGLITWDTTVSPGTYAVTVTPTSNTAGAGIPRAYQWRVETVATDDPGAWAPHLRTRRR